MKLKYIASVLAILILLSVMVGCGRTNAKPSATNTTIGPSLSSSSSPKEAPSSSEESSQVEDESVVINNDPVILTENVWGLTYDEAAEIVQAAGYTCVQSFISYGSSMMHGQNERVEEIMQLYGFTDYEQLYGRVFGTSCRTGRQIIDHRGEARDGSGAMFPYPGASDMYDVAIVTFGTSEQFLSQKP